MKDFAKGATGVVSLLAILGLVFLSSLPAIV